MARLASEARGLYFRTQDPLAEPLAALLELPRGGRVNLLDPCAGAGVFLSTLYARMRPYAAARDCKATIVSYGVEPNRERAQAARQVFTHLLCADFFHTRIERERFHLALLNPPYDEDLSEVGSGDRARLELRFLRRVTPLLAPEAVLVYIVPQAQLVPAARHLAAHYTRLRCWRYPDLAWAAPEEVDADGQPRTATSLYAQFHQVVLFASHRAASVAPNERLVREIQDWAYADADLPPIPLDPERLALIPGWPVPGDVVPGDVAQPNGDQPDQWSSMRQREDGEPVARGALAERPIEFADPTLDLAEAASQLMTHGGGVWADADYREQRWPDLARLRLGMDRPLGPLRLGHLITLAAIGLLNGRILTGPDGRRLLVKGACRKEVIVEQEIDHVPSGRSTLTKTETERFVIALWAIDLASGELIHIA